MSCMPRRAAPQGFLERSRELDINFVDAVNWSSEWRIDTQIQPQTQAVETEFKKVCIDSGVAESVCPIDAFPDYETIETDKILSRRVRNIPHFDTAHGEDRAHLGIRRRSSIRHACWPSLQVHAGLLVPSCMHAHHARGSRGPCLH